jgi:hypothetical protein
MSHRIRHWNQVGFRAEADICAFEAQNETG